MQEVERLLSGGHAWIYGALFAYALIKTGPLPIFAGYASTLGWLDWVPTLSAVWTGAVCGDLVRFELGRRFGPAALSRFPTWERRTGALVRVVEKHYMWICLTKRFAKGLRTPLSLALGLTALPRPRVVAITIMTAGVWAGSFVGLGAAAGSVIERTSGAVVAITGLAVMAVLLAALGWLVHREIRRTVDGAASPNPTASSPA